MDSQDTNILNFYLAGDPDLEQNVPADAFVDALRHYLEALKAIDRTQRARSSRPTVKWMLLRVDNSSASAYLKPVPLTINGLTNAQGQAQISIVALNQIREGRTATDIVSGEVEDHLRRIIEIGKQNHLPEIGVRFNDLSANFEVKGIVELFPSTSRRQSIGSVEGELLQLNFVSDGVFQIRDRMTGKLIPCDIQRNSPLLPLIGSAILHRVRVTGLINRGEDERITVSEVQDIFVFPDDDTLPDIDDLVGLDLDFTDGMVASEWIRSARE